MNEDNNQTMFSAEEPLFQPETMSGLTPDEQPVSQRKWFQRPIVIIVAVVVVVMLLLVSLAVALRPRTQEPVLFESTPSPSPVFQSNPLQVKVKDLQKELLEADPAKQELPFPAVDMGLKIPDDKQFR